MRTVVVLLAVICGASGAAHAEAAGPDAESLRLALLPPALDIGYAAVSQASSEVPLFGKYYRRHIPREIVWFNGREGDLEKHAVRRGGYIYITLTDLIRHIGGSIVWGPRYNFVQVKRGNLTVRVFPGAAKVIVNGEAQSIGAATFRAGGRLWVPVKPLAELFGCTAEWNAALRRLEVTL
jgi:hypothetical protein